MLKYVGLLVLMNLSGFLKSEYSVHITHFLQLDVFQNKIKEIIKKNFFF